MKSWKVLTREKRGRGKPGKHKGKEFALKVQSIKLRHKKLRKNEETQIIELMKLTNEKK